MTFGKPIFTRNKLFELLYDRNRGFKSYTSVEMVTKKDLYSIHDSITFKCNKGHHPMEMSVLDLLRSNFLLVGTCNQCMSHESKRRNTLLDRF